MSKGADVGLACRECGKQFVFTEGEQEFYKRKGFAFPSRCQECRSTKQSQSHHVVCAQCGAELEKEASIYCTACLESVHLESELKTKQSQRAASAAHTKLLATESQKAELEESVRQKEKLIAELELQVSSLGQDLEKEYHLHAGLQPALDGIDERLKALEYAQNKVNERMLQLVQRIHEMYESTSLLEIIKRSLGQYRKEGA